MFYPILSLFLHQYYTYITYIYNFKTTAFLTDQLPVRAIAYPKIGGSSRCTTCLERTSKYCCKTPKGRCCDYGYEPSKNDIIRGDGLTLPYCKTTIC
jgi:hypothetical protein